jgi:hypothetical protein
VIVPSKGLADNGIVGELDDGGQAFAHSAACTRSVTSRKITVKSFCRQ